MNTTSYSDRLREQKRRLEAWLTRHQDESYDKDDATEEEHSVEVESQRAISVQVDDKRIELWLEALRIESSSVFVQNIEDVNWEERNEHNRKNAY